MPDTSFASDAPPEETAFSPPGDLLSYGFNLNIQEDLNQPDLLDELDPPTDKEARALVDSTNSGLDPDDLAWRQQRMEAYFQNQERKQARTADLKWRGIHTSLQKRKELLDTEPFARARENTAFPEIADYQSLNMAEIEHLTGQKVTTENYEAMKNALAWKRFGEQRMGDRAFFDANTKLHEQDAEMETAWLETRDKLRTDYVERGEADPAKAMMATVKAHPELFDEEKEKNFYWFLFKDAQKFSNTVGQVGELPRLLLDALQTDPATMEAAGPIEQATQQAAGLVSMATGVSAPTAQIVSEAVDWAVALANQITEAGTPITPQWVKFLKRLEDVTPRQEEMFWETISALERNNKIPKGTIDAVFSNVGKAMGEKGIGQWLVSEPQLAARESQLADEKSTLLSEYPKFVSPEMVGGRVRFLPPGVTEQEMPAGVPYGMPPPKKGEAATYEQVKRRLADILAEEKTLNSYRRAKDILEQAGIEGYQYVTPEGTAWRTMEGGTYSVIESLMPGLAGGTLPTLGRAAFAVTMAMQANSRGRLQNPDVDPRLMLSYSMVEGAINGYIEGIEWAGRLGRIPGLRHLRQDIRDGKGWAVIKDMLAQQGFETTTEVTQNAVSSFIGWAASQHGINPLDLGTEFNKFIASIPDTAIGMFLPALVSGGALAYHDLRNPWRDVLSVEALRQNGYSAKQQDRIHTAYNEAGGQAAFNVMVAEAGNRTPADIEKGAKEYQAQLDKALQERKIESIQIEARVGEDGEKRYHVVDGEGKSLFETRSYEVAEAEQVRQIGLARQREAIAAMEAQQTEIAKAAQAEKEAAAGLVPRTAAGVGLEFKEGPITTEEQDLHAKIEAGLSAGMTPAEKAQFASKVTLVKPTPTTLAGQQTLNTIGVLNKIFRTKVVFARSAEEGKPLRGNAFYVPGTDTIVLDADSEANMISLIGHEWTHHLEKTDRAAWVNLMARLKPIVKDWVAQTSPTGPVGQLYKGATTETLTSEYVANVVGDVFGDPDFWLHLKTRDPSLFDKIMEAILKFFDATIAQAGAFGTKDTIADLTELKNIVADTLTLADRHGEAALAEGAPTAPSEAAMFALPNVFRRYTYIGEGIRQEERAAAERTAAEAEVSRRAQPAFTAFLAGLRKLGWEQALEVGLRASAERAQRLGRLLAVEPDPRLKATLGAFQEYTSAGFPRIIQPNEAEWPADMRMETYLKPYADVGRELAKKLKIEPGRISRTDLHRAILDYFLRDAKAKLGRIFIISGGGIGSGKSTILREKEGFYNPRQQGYVHIDVDAIRSLLPEWDVLTEIYYDTQAGARTAVETMRLGDQLLQEAVARGLPVFYDTPASRPDVFNENILKPLKAAGYTGKMVQVITEPYEAAVRTFLRGNDMSGDGYFRWVPPDLTFGNHTRFHTAVAEESYQKLLGAENVVHYENSGFDQPKVPRPQPAAAEAQIQPIYFLPGEETGQRVPDIMMSRRRGDDIGRQHRMEIERQERQVAKVAYYSNPERTFANEAIERRLDADKIPEGPERATRRAEMRSQVEKTVLEKRMEFPDRDVPDPWAQGFLTGVKIEYTPGKNGEAGKYKAKPTWQEIPFNFDEGPAGMSREEWVDEMKDRVITEIYQKLRSSRRNADVILQQMGWYKNFTPKLRREFGGFADLFADFLGAFSPQNGVSMNWRDAIVAAYQMTQGKYDELFEKVEAYLAEDPKHTVDSWVNSGGAQIRKVDGSLFGLNSRHGMKAALDLWREVKKGDSPKARNFTANLIGLSLRATIDRWAGRSLQRLAGKRRIPLYAEGEVPGKHLDETHVGGAFGFAQDVFEAAATEMRESGDERFADIDARGAQAMMWFVEKEHWGEHSWMPEEAEGGSFEEMIAQQLLNRFQIGISQQIVREGEPTFIPETTENVDFGNDVWADLNNLTDVVMTRAIDTVGMYLNDVERSLDVEALTGPNVKPEELIKIGAKHGGGKRQSNVLITRVIVDDEEINSNARPGLEIMFRRQIDSTGPEMQAILQLLRRNGVDGFTMVADPRSATSPYPDRPGLVWGVRFQYVPELSGDIHWHENATDIGNTVVGLLEAIGAMEGVSYAQALRYDTLVLSQGVDYDEQGIFSSALSGREAALWRKRVLDANAQVANREFQQPSQDVYEPFPYRSKKGKAPKAGRRGRAESRAGPETGGLAPQIQLAARRRAPPDQVDVSDAKENGAYMMDREGRIFDVDATAGSHGEYVEKYLGMEDLGEAFDYGWLRVVAFRGTLYWNGVEATPRQQRALADIGDTLGFNVQHEAHEEMREGINVRGPSGLVFAKRPAPPSVESQVARYYEAPGTRIKMLEHLLANYKRAIAQGAAKVAKAGPPETRMEELRAARARQVQTFAELRAIQMALPPDIRGRIGGELTLAQLGASPEYQGKPEALAQFLAGRIEKIGAVLEKQLQTEYRERITSLAKRYKERKIGGVKRGRIGEAQDVVNQVLEITKRENDDVASEQAAIEQALSVDGIDPDEESRITIRQHLLQVFGALEEQSAAQLSAAYDELVQTIADGRSAWGEAEEERLGTMHDNAGKIVAGYGGVGSGAGVAAAAVQGRAKQMIKGFIVSIYNFGQAMREMLPGEGKSVANAWTKRAERADRGDQDFVRRHSNAFAAAIQQAVGSKSAIRTGNVLHKMTQLTLPGKDGLASPLQAIQYQLAWQNEDVQKRMIKQGWTDAHMAAFEKGTSDPVSLAIKDFLRREYDSLYTEIDRVYVRMFGTHLAKVDFYTPMHYFHGGTETEAVTLNLFGGPLGTSGTTPSFAMARVPHNAPLRQEDAMMVYLGHLQQVSHFIHYAELIREIRGTLNQSQVKPTLMQNLGPYQYDVMMRWIDALARRGQNKANEIKIAQDFLNVLVSGKAISALILNPKTIAMQVDSMLRFTTALPARAFMRTIVDGSFYSNIPKTFFSDAIQRRIQHGMNPEMQYVLHQARITPSLLLELSRKGMAPIQYADALFTSISGAVVYTSAYREAIKTGLSDAQADAAAAEALESAIHNFSQPTGLTSRSIIEVNTSGTMKLFMLFMSDPRLKSAIIMENLLGLYRFRENSAEQNAEHLKNITSVMFWGFLSQLIANLYRDWATDDDDDDIWTLAGFARAALLAPVQGWWMVGDIIDSTARWLLGEKVYQGASDPLSEAMGKMQRIYKHRDDLLNPEDPVAMAKAWDNVLKAAALVPPFGQYVAPLNAVTNVLKPVVAGMQEAEEARQQKKD